MSKILLSLCAFGAVALATPALAQETTTYNSAPTGGFQYGTGNDYTPANAAVLTSTDGEELALRFHQTYVVAPASDANGVYSFALGTDPISFDFSIFGDTSGSNITLINLLTGNSVSYDPLCPLVVICLNDNVVTTSGAIQNSEQLGFSMFSALGFDPNVNDTYKAILTSGGYSLTAYAQIGSGAPAVPEPGTWAMMLLGLAGIGFAMQRRLFEATQPA